MRVREHRTIDRSRLPSRSRSQGKARQGKSATARGYYASGDVISAWRSGSLSLSLFLSLLIYLYKYYEQRGRTHDDLDQSI